MQALLKSLSTWLFQLRAPERGDRVLERRRRRARRIVAPQGVDEEIGRDHAVRAQQKERENRPLLLPPERQQVAAVGDCLERP